MTGLNRFFESYYRLRPVNATFTGMHEHDHRLPDWSPDGLEAAADEMRALQRDLTVDPGGERELIDVSARDRALAASFLDVQLAELEGTHFARGNPSLAIGEAVFGVIALMIGRFASVEQRVEAAAARLSATPRFLDDARRGLPHERPAEWRSKALRECEGAARIFGAGIQRWIALDSIADPLAERLSRASSKAMEGLERFRTWLARETSEAPAARYAAGPEMFERLLVRGHWCTRSLADLVHEANDAFDEALARLDERARAAAPGGWPEIRERLENHHPEVDGYLGAFQRVWDACRARAEACDLVSWPEYPIRYVPIPDHTRDAAPLLYYLHYRSPAPLDPPGVHEYVVTPIDRAMPADEQERRLRANNFSVITLNHVVHHGAIGHHVQNYRAYHGQSEIGRIAAVDCAGRIGMFLGGTMAEGWACYATDLMDEVGFLSADESIAQQHTRARLLARAVVDIGLHTGSMSFDEGAAVYRDRVGMAPDAARAEACKNSMFPATAIMYWLGTEGLHRLRRTRVRGAVTLRLFHDRMLSYGSIPVPLVERIWQ
jgi:hypothetical protein